MAIYHLEAKMVSRGAGRSAVAASAYLSCSRMLNEYDGVQHDYAEDAGAETFRKDIAALESNLEKLDEQEQKYSAALDAALHEYAEVKSQAAGLDPVELYEARQAIRLGQEAAANEKLEQVFGSKYSLLRWMDAKQAQIRLTNDSLEEYAARQQAKQKYKSISQPVRKRNHKQER